MTVFLRRCGPVDRNTRTVSLLLFQLWPPPPDKVQKYGNGFVTKQKEKHLTPMPEFFCLVASFEEEQKHKDKQNHSVGNKTQVLLAKTNDWMLYAKTKRTVRTL